MNVLKIAVFRLRQNALRAASYFVHWHVPAAFQGDSALADLAAFIARRKISRVLVVTDRTMVSLGIAGKLFDALGSSGIGHSVFADAMTDPTTEAAYAAAAQYKDSGCAAVIAIGGGSAIDCAKAASAVLSRPGMPLERMAGILKVLRRRVPLFAVPTTAGTGSEATAAAVVSDPVSHRKFVISDPCLIPDGTAFDPRLLTGLPAKITAETGLDALCHAVEAYVGRNNTRETRQLAESAARTIFSTLEYSASNPADTAARAAMQQAAFQAGRAFTRAYIGYAHAIAHALGGTYRLPHGLACAVSLPAVLEGYGSAARRPLERLAESAGFPASADCFISELRALNERLGLPSSLSCIRPEDIESLSQTALREANPAYPVPRIFDHADMTEVLRKITGNQTSKAGSTA